jgi:hypothetical protein
MPNLSNIDAPVTLIAPGRSGTSLISAIFAGNPDVSVCGETVDLVFDLWNAAQRSISHISPPLTSAALAAIDERVSTFVRQGFLSLLSDDNAFWFQKPIGIPFAFSPALLHFDSWDDRADLYWTVMRTVFPRGRFFTVLRHPCDVVMSFKKRFDADEHTSWAVMGFLAHIIGHPKSLVRYAVSYDRLITDSEATVRSLLSFLEIPYDSRMMDAFNTVHTRSAHRESSCDNGFSWEDTWSDLNPQFVERRFVEPIRRLYAKFGHELSIPADLLDHREPSTDGSPTEPPVKSIDAEVAQMRGYIRHLEMQAANLQAIWEERALRQENEHYQECLKLQAQISNLRRRRHLWGRAADFLGKIRRSA